jgi:hypothetical protein
LGALSLPEIKTERIDGAIRQELTDLRKDLATVLLNVPIFPPCSLPARRMDARSI